MTIPVDFVLKAKDNTSAVFGRVGQKLDALKTKMGGLNRLGGAMKGIGVAGAVALTVVSAVTVGLFHQALQVDDNIGKLQDLTDKYKISTDSLQVYGRVAGEAGVELETVAKGLGKLSENIAKARNGGANNIDLLASVGVKGKDLNKSTEQIFDQISTIFNKKNKSSNDVQKILAAKALFGKAGIELMPLLEMGGKGLHDVMEQMRKDGTILSKEQIAAADTVADNFGYAKSRLDAVRKTALIQLNPAIQVVTDSINKMLDSGGSSKIQQVFKAIGDQIIKIAPDIIAQIPVILERISKIDMSSILSGIGQFATGLAAVGRFIGNVGNYVGWDKVLFGGIVIYALPAAAALYTLIPAMYGFIGAVAIGIITAAPILLLLAALSIALYLLYDNWDMVSSFWVGAWDSVVGATSNAIGVIIPALKNIGGAVLDHFTAPLRLAIDAVNLLIRGMNRLPNVKIPEIPQIKTFSGNEGANAPTNARAAGVAGQKSSIDINIKTPPNVTAVATPQQGGKNIRVKTGKMA